MQQVFGRQGAMAGTKLGEAIATPFNQPNLEDEETQTGVNRAMPTGTLRLPTRI